MLMASKASSKIGDRSTSDVVVRLRTHEGRDDWMYCHSHILVEKSKYFADRLSENWPTCQILDSRNCVEVYCQESDFDHHVNFLRLLYVIDGLMDDVWHGVRNALGILHVAVDLGCPQIIIASVDYLEAVPWEEVEEEEILRVIPGLGSQAQPILARVQPVDPSAIAGVFLSTIRFATSSPPPPMNDLKTSAQEQLEYMITEDDDAPLITADDEIKSEVNQCMMQLFSKFNNLLESLSCEPLESISEVGKLQSFQSHLSDLSWACQILTKLEIMKEFVNCWVDVSDKIVKTIEISNQTTDMISSKVKVIEVTAKVLEVIGYGTVILPTAKRLHMVNVWLPFVRVVKPLIDCIMDGDLWQSLESTFVSIVLALPSVDQAGILTEWLGNKHTQYPDLTEAFEVWCYRSKVAKRRFAAMQDGLGDVPHTL
ncbi:BTB/POZ domain-containing protein At3g05675 isoform X2 [Tripterygium wilfordii]|uniref:BTB/POZ domain-containing protein At3g05675 isoform X2 n=1 Tax=Tripterygium wilfordii TaxID=458696 RepID=UPI0018F7EFB9|nr:BTB/POZ domain-containing protein At3g05675 isoform X2 [Tripterygium wilfordii]